MLTAALPSIEAMTRKKKTLSWLPVLILTGLGILASPERVLTRTPEVARALNPVLSSYEVLRFEPGEIEQQIRTTGELRLRFDGTDFQFNLKPHSLRAPNYRAVETGLGGARRTLPTQPVRTFKGTLAEREDTRGRFNLTGRGVEGVIYAPEGLYYVEPLRNYLPGAADGELVVYRHADVKPGEDFQCGVSLPERLQRGVARVEVRTETETSDSPTNYVVDVATEADYEYVQVFGGSAEANREIEGILNVVEGVYQSELLLQLQIDFQHAWTTKDESYPYTATNGGVLIDQFADYWNTHFATQEDYDLGHLWTAKAIPLVAGLAKTGKVCSTRSESYSLSEYQPGSGSMWMNYLIPAHEIGHNFGAVHPDQLNPPITTCDTTIMVANVFTAESDPQLTFCGFSRQQMADYIADNNSCLGTQTITLQPPSDLTATAASSSSINLAWEDNSTDESGFIVQRRREGSGEWVQIASTAADTTTLSNDRLISKSTYLYRVQAFNDSESSAYSNEGEATTPAGTAVVTERRIHTIAGRSDNGDNGPASESVLGNPQGVAVDSSGNLYIADSQNHRIRKVDSSGIITTVAGTGDGGYGGDGGLATSAMLNNPSEVAVDGSGNLYISDTRNLRIRKVDSMGTITTIAGTGTSGYSGDGGLATSAMLNNPSGVAVDSSGNLYIADFQNLRIRKVNTSGTITTVAGIGRSGYSGDGGLATSAMLNNPSGVAVDGSGNLYIADSGNLRIRKVDTMGTITTVAGTGVRGYSGDGGLGTSAMLNDPSVVAVDGSGDLYIADRLNHRIRKVDNSGNIATVAGIGRSGHSGDGGPATAARLDYPSGVAVDGSGDLYIADRFNHRIRKVDNSGNIATVAGIGRSELQRGWRPGDRREAVQSCRSGGR